MNYGVALYKIAEVEQAIATFKRVIELDAERPEAQYNLADIYFTMGELDKAEEHYRQAVVLDPKDIRSRVNLGVTLVQQTKYTKALDQFKELIALDPESKDGHFNLGVIYSDYVFDRDKAIYHYSKYMEIAPFEEDAEQVRDWIERLRQ